MCERLTPRWKPWQSIPLKLRTLQEVLSPQPAATRVYKRLLDWIHRVAVASRTGAPRPPFATEEGAPIFPEDGDKWWLTDVQLRAAKDETGVPRGDEDGPGGHSSGDEVVTDAAVHVEDDFAHTDSDIDVTDYEDDARFPHADDSHTYQQYLGHECRLLGALDHSAGAPRSAIRDRAASRGSTSSS